MYKSLLDSFGTFSIIIFYGNCCLERYFVCVFVLFVLVV